MAVAGDGEVDGDAVGEAVVVGEVEASEAAGFETASCAVTILVIKRIAPNAIGKFFMKVVCRSSFQSLGDWLWRSDLLECQSEVVHLHKCDRESGEAA